MTTTDDDLMQRTTSVFDLPDGLEVRAGADGGHMLRGVVVPYNEVALIGGRYTESFAPGVFAKSVAERGDRIGLSEMHKRDAFPIGRSTAWEETADGLVATFKMPATDRATEAIELVNTGFLDGLSVGFRPVRNRPEQRGGVHHVVRVEAAMDHVGLVTGPAYKKSLVLEARDDEDDHGPFDPDSVLAAPRLARWRALNGLRG